MARRNSCGLDVDHPREHRRHRIVDPHVDRPQLALDPLGGRLDGVVVSDVDRHDERLSAELLHLGLDVLQRRLAARQQRRLRAALGERVRDRPTDSARRAGDDDDLAHVASSSSVLS